MNSFKEAARFFEEHFKKDTLKKDGCVIHYWLSRRKDAPWLIFLHGACADHRSFYYQLPAVYESYNVLLWDARGHGSSRPTDGFSVRLLIGDLDAVMQKETIEKAALIGHSAGGNLAQAFACEYPEKIESLVIIDSTWNMQRLKPLEKWALKSARGILSLYSWKSLVNQSAKVSSSKAEKKRF